MKKRRKSKLYRRVEQFVIDAFGPGHPILTHLQRTVHWMLELNPNADDALLVAAFSHDIERAWSNEYFGVQQIELTREYLSEHQNRSAEIMETFLTGSGAPTRVIQRVKEIISKHEIGGNDDQDLLKDADSLSFLENSIEIFLNEAMPKLGFELVKRKFDWTFTRISSEKARHIALPLFQEARERLRFIREGHGKSAGYDAGGK